MLQCGDDNEVDRHMIYKLSTSGINKTTIIDTLYTGLHSSMAISSDGDLSLTKTCPLRI